MPASGRYPYWAIQSALRSRQTLQGAYSLAVRRGLTLTRGGFTRLYNAARAELESGYVEPLRPLNRFPVGDEIEAKPTVTARGYQQKVMIFSRDKATRQVVVKPYTMTAPGVLTRQGAIARAVEAYREFEEQYQQVVLGGIYGGTFELQPGLLG